MKQAITLEKIKKACDEYLYHIAIRASRGADEKNKIIADYYEKAIIEVSKLISGVSYPQNMREMRVRIVTPNNKFTYTRFGCFFFVGDEMYIISEDKQYSKYHNPEVHKTDSRLEVLDDSTTYTVPVLFAGIYTGIKDRNDKQIFTGDIVKAGHNIAGVDIIRDDFQHIYDNHSLRLSELESFYTEPFERVSTVFYDLRRNEPAKNIRGRCNELAQYIGDRNEFIEFIKTHQLYLDIPEHYTINTYITNENNSARFALGYNNTNPLIVIGLNPSTADDTKADQTISRVIGFAKRNGFNGFIMLNVYPQRAKDPKNLHSEDEFDLTLHKQNLEHIERIIEGASNTYEMTLFSTIRKRYPPPIGRNATVLVVFGNSITKRKYLAQCFKDILDVISSYYVRLKTIGRLTQNGNGHPRHPSRAGYVEFRDLCTQSYIYGLLND